MKYGGEIAMMDILEEQGLLDWENPPMLNPNTWKVLVYFLLHV